MIRKFLERAEGTLMRYRGAWVLGATYAVWDIITNDGMTYYGKLGHTAAGLVVIEVGEHDEVSGVELCGGHCGLPDYALLLLAVADDDEDMVVYALHPAALGHAEADGHAVVSVAGHGYQLGTGSDVLSAEGIRPFLHRQDVTVRGEACVDSTNTVAKELAAAGAAHGSVVAAGQQTAGRGRRGRAFSSPADTGLYLSVILRSGVSMTDAALITSAAAVAVCRAVERVCKHTDLRIKWVNDLYRNEKKCCGILTEAAADMESGGVDYLIVGIGINLCQPAGGFPPELASIATSVFDANEHPAAVRCRLTAAVVNELLPLAEALPAASFMEEYRARNLVPGREVTIVQNGAERPAHALSITDSAHLLVRLPDGSEEELSFGEVSLRL